MVLGVPFLVLAPFGGGWLACRVVRPERRLVMRLASGVLVGSVGFGIATVIAFNGADPEKIHRILGDSGLFIFSGVGLTVASWLGALLVSGSSPLRSDAHEPPNLRKNGILR